MRRLTLALALLSLAVPALSERSLVVGVDYSGRLLVKPKVGAGQALRGLDVKIRLDKLGIVAVQVPSKHDPLAYGRQLMATGSFEYAHPDYICHPIEIPNDPQVLQQWHLFQVSAPSAWDATAGSGSVVIAITDTGVDLTHPDLQNRVPGYNAVTNLAEANGGDVSDIHSTGHGTRVTGLACATGNNGIGIAGVAYASPFMPIRISNQINGTALMSDILEGITWAVDHGAKVINTSYDQVQVPAVQTAGEYAWNNGAVSVWGAGNGNVDTKTLPDPDLEWDHRRVIVVGSTDQNDAKASFSNFGKAVDIFAPGTQLLTTSKGGGYGNVSGTSYSAPLVSGTIALALSVSSTLGFDKRIAMVLRNCRDLGVSVEPGQSGYRPGNDTYWGWGRLNAGAAISGRHLSLRYSVRLLEPLLGYQNSFVTSINDKGEVVGDSFTGSNELATIWSPEDVATAIPLPASTSSYCTRINNSSEVVCMANDSGRYWIYRYLNGNTTRMPDPWGGAYNPAIAADINEQGTIIGRVGDHSIIFWPRGVNPYGADPGTGLPQQHGYAINDNGYFAGRHGPNGSGDWLGFFWNGQAYGQLSWYYYWGSTYAESMNNDNLTVGYSTNGGTPSKPICWDMQNAAFDVDLGWGQARDINEFNEVVGFDDQSSTAKIFDGFKVGHLITLLDAEGLPNGITKLLTCFGVNNRHSIVGTALRTDGRIVGYRADPVEGIQVTVDLGQLGSNPIYLGALPPACVVDFRDEAGNYIPNSRREYEYNSGTGHIQVAIPPEVTGAYRMYFRLTNVNDNPDYAAGGWEGPGYLGKVYPPMTEPALPIDAIYVPDMVLYVGDCDSDNEIAIGDYAVLSAAYGSWAGVSDPRWDPRADLDGDEEISIGDYAILSGNYGLTGD